MLSVGGSNSGHAHDASPHTHTQSSHTHTATVTGDTLSSGLTNTRDGNPQNVKISLVGHSHTLTVGSATIINDATILGISPTSVTADMPPYYFVAFIQYGSVTPMPVPDSQCGYALL